MAWMRKENLAAVLRHMADEVEADDSWEGTIEYMFSVEGDEPYGFEVTAAYRTGNLEGQGSLRLIR